MVARVWYTMLKACRSRNSRRAITPNPAVILPATHRVQVPTRSTNGVASMISAKHSWFEQLQLLSKVLRLQSDVLH